MTRNHHYLPEFHLKRFACGPRREVGVFDKKWGKFGRAPAVSSARARDYYLVPGTTLDARLAVEREFARLENMVAPLIARLDTADPGPVPLDDVDRHNLASYAAILHVTGPAYRDDAQKRAVELSTDLDALGLADPAEFRRAARRQGMKGTNEELEQKRIATRTLLATGRMRIDVPFAATLGSVPIAVARGVPLMLARDWELLRARISRRSSRCNATTIAEIQAWQPPDLCGHVSGDHVGDSRSSCGVVTMTGCSRG